MTKHVASCSCGQLRATCEGEPVRVSVCHCLECQKRTGSTYGAQARWPADRVALLGDATVFVRVADSGNKARFYFCPLCGSTVWYQLEHYQDVIAIPVGAFADPGFPAPKFSVYEARSHAWVSVPPDVERRE